MVVVVQERGRVPSYPKKKAHTEERACRLYQRKSYKQKFDMNKCEELVTTKHKEVTIAHSKLIFQPYNFFRANSKISSCRGELERSLLLTKENFNRREGRKGNRVVQGHKL